MKYIQLAIMLALVACLSHAQPMQFLNKTSHIKYCEQGFTLAGNQCKRTLTTAVTYTCETGYTLNQQSCSRQITQQKVCPEGTTEESGICYGSEAWKESDYNYVYIARYFLFFGDYYALQNKHGDTIKEGSSYEMIRRSTYRTGARVYVTVTQNIGGKKYKPSLNCQGIGSRKYKWDTSITGRGEIARDYKKYLDDSCDAMEAYKPRHPKECPTGFTANPQHGCLKVVTTPATPTCPGGQLTPNNNACLETQQKPVSRMSRISVVEKMLYPYYAENIAEIDEYPEHQLYSKRKAALRYLEKIKHQHSTLTIQSLLGEIENFPTLDDQQRIDAALKIVQEGFSTAHSRALMLDIHHDIALLLLTKYKVKNMQMKAKRLGVAPYSNADNLTDMAELLPDGDLFERLYDYVEFVNENSATIAQTSDKRYLFERAFPDLAQQANANNHQDIVLALQVMTYLAKTIKEASKLHVLEGSDSDTTLQWLNTSIERLLTMDESLSTYLKTHLQSSMKTIVFQKSEYDTALEELIQARQWVQGSLNTLEIPKNYIRLYDSAYKQSNFDTFDVMQTDVANNLSALQANYASHQNNFDAYQHNSTNINKAFFANQTEYKRIIFDLSGIDITNFCQSPPCVLEADNYAEGSAIKKSFDHVERLKTELAEKALTVENIQTKMELAIENDQSDTINGNNQHAHTLRFGDLELSIQDEIRSAQRKITQLEQDEELRQDKLNLIQGTLSLNKDAISETINPVTYVRSDSKRTLFKQKMLQEASIRAFERESELLALQEEKIKHELAGQQSETTLQFTLKKLALELTTAKLEVSHTEQAIDKAIAALPFLINKLKTTIHWYYLSHHNIQQLYAGNPIHQIRSHKSLDDVAKALLKSQKKLFFLAQAFEYKWQDSLVNLGGSDIKSLILNARTPDELQEAYDSIDDLNISLSSSRVSADTTTTILSLKKDILGLKNKQRKKFRSHLKANGALSGWVTFNFDTFVSPKNRNFFSNGFYSSQQQCFVTAGHYNDKIETIALRIKPNVRNRAINTHIQAILTYGHTSYFRKKEITSQNDVDKIESLIQHSNLSDLGTSVIQANFDATTHKNASLITTDKFSELSVASKGWRLSLELPVNSQSQLSVADINDIEIIVKHRSNRRLNNPLLCRSENLLK